MKWILRLGLLAVLAFAVVIGGSYYHDIKDVIGDRISISLDKERAEQRPRTADDVYRSEQSKDERNVTVYRASSDGQALVGEVYTVAKTDETIAQALGLLLSEPSDSNNWSTIPDGTKVRSIHFANGIARVDFSSEIVKNFRGGSAGELLMVGSIVNTLTEIHGVEKVRIMVNGKQVKTIGGHVDLSEPLGRMEDLLKK
ncbi:MAG: GerMN domain-containing protein [Selenomonadales bacterium]|jgi:spore germination protein GerM|nr:GerMN domain-containing protein [Selenomonadales bacterium]MBQ2114762.1 GerMN domain-containing protein [Selenomonadales bacterium]MBQ2245684.1 GerMN domain-containing protein [Selenomonadales bacterium]MBQ5636702.1 GerMN domain-containing protein [Selenomonadales bacterium]MBQ5745762.1 GerMN domain-containing protein [Selenomonadales bacterium]